MDTWFLTFHDSVYCAYFLFSLFISAFLRNKHYEVIYLDQTEVTETIKSAQRDTNLRAGCTKAAHSVIFVNENENENYQKRKNNDFVNEN